MVDSSAELGQIVAANNPQCLFSPARSAELAGFTTCFGMRKRNILTVKYIKSKPKRCSLLKKMHCTHLVKNIDKYLTSELSMILGQMF